MENKLELRHLAGYLEHGLKCKRIPISDLWDEKIVELTALDVADKIAIFHKSADYYFDDEEKEFDIKPLVIPLSQLTKEDWIEVFKAGLDFDASKISVSICSKFINFYCVEDSMTYYIKEKHFAHSVFDRYFNQLLAFEKLYSLHADLHGLIEKGLGLNKNDYEK